MVLAPPTMSMDLGAQQPTGGQGADAVHLPASMRAFIFVSQLMFWNVTKAAEKLASDGTGALAMRAANAAVPGSPRQAQTELVDMLWSGLCRWSEDSENGPQGNQTEGITTGGSAGENAMRVLAGATVGGGTGTHIPFGPGGG